MPTTYAIPNGRAVMDVTIWTGTSTASARSFTNNDTGTVGFKPDFVWAKSRNPGGAGYNHQLYDSVRGTGKRLSCNLTDAETTNPINGYVSSFDSNGFSTTPGTTDNSWFNETNTTMVAWQWQAGAGTTSSNTNGSITSTVSVNAAAGFSVVSYTGTGANATVGHGLGVAPSMVIVKSRTNAATNWATYHISIGPTKYLLLNTTDASTTASTPWNNTAPTSSVFSLGSGTSVNPNGAAQIAYCWAEVAGFSAFGSYTGNGSTDGPFVYTGFRPKFVMFKCSNVAGTNWFIRDTSRNPYNAADLALWPNLSDAEGSGAAYDILSNGFKVRSSASGVNGSGDTVIYMAFAENPFKYANAR